MGITAALLATATAVHAAPPIIKIQKLAAPPKLDGIANEWKGPWSKVGMMPGTTRAYGPKHKDILNKSGTKTIEVQAGHHGGKIFFAVRVPDKTKDVDWHTLIWSNAEKTYIESKNADDGVALKFDVAGDFDACMLAQREYIADVWHWMAGRTDFTGRAEDQVQLFSKRPIPGGRQRKAKGGGVLYIRQGPDAGVRPFKPAEPTKKMGDKIPGFTKNPKPSGSLADVGAKGNFAGGLWVVEFARAFTVADPLDARFTVGQKKKFSIAIWNGDEMEHHSTSEELSLVW